MSTPAPVWDDDHPTDAAHITINATTLLRDLATSASARTLPALGVATSWHSRIYADCSVPVAGYVGHFRGDASVPALVGYEVGVGADLPDGLPEKVGVWSQQLDGELTRFLPAVHAGLRQLDGALPSGTPATTSEEVHAVLQLAAVVHGEWVRMHPFANGSGRTARVRAQVVPDPYRPQLPPQARADHGLVVGMVGRLAPWKDQDVFLRAFGAAFVEQPWVQPRIVGSASFGEHDYVAGLRTLTTELGLDGRVTFVGFTTEVEHELGRLDVLVHTSVVAEPFGQVVVEGMAAGLPIVATAAGGPLEIITAEVDGLLTAPGDVAELATALLARRARRLFGAPG